MHPKFNPYALAALVGVITVALHGLLIEFFNPVGMILWAVTMGLLGLAYGYHFGYLEGSTDENRHVAELLEPCLPASIHPQVERLIKVEKVFPGTTADYFGYHDKHLRELANLRRLE